MTRPKPLVKSSRFFRPRMFARGLGDQRQRLVDRSRLIAQLVARGQAPAERRRRLVGGLTRRPVVALGAASPAGGGREHGGFDPLPVPREVGDEAELLVVGNDGDPVVRSEPAAEELDGVLAGADLTLQETGSLEGTEALVVEEQDEVSRRFAASVHRRRRSVAGGGGGRRGGCGAGREPAMTVEVGGAHSDRTARFGDFEVIRAEPEDHVAAAIGDDHVEEHFGDRDLASEARSFVRRRLGLAEERRRRRERERRGQREGREPRAGADPAAFRSRHLALR